MKNKERNYAFIDGNNLYLSTSNDIFNKKGRRIYRGWKVDYKRFRQYLKDKFNVEKAYLFIGFNPENQSMYTNLQQLGYVCIFKPILEMTDGKVKGNVDAELVLHAMIEYRNYSKAVIVSGDGDFYCLIEYLAGQGKLKKVLIPNEYSYSSLLDKLNPEKNDILGFISRLRGKLEYRHKKRSQILSVSPVAPAVIEKDKKVSYPKNNKKFLRKTINVK